MKVARLSALRTDHLHPNSTPQDLFLVHVSVRAWVNPRAIQRSEGLCRWKIPMIPSGIERATLRFVAHCLNQLRHHLPPPLYLYSSPDTRGQVSSIIQNDVRFLIKIFTLDTWNEGQHSLDLVTSSWIKILFLIDLKYCNYPYFQSILFAIFF
jgi:hypothetical protein